MERKNTTQKMKKTEQEQGIEKNVHYLPKDQRMNLRLQPAFITLCLAKKDYRSQS